MMNWECINLCTGI